MKTDRNDNLEALGKTASKTYSDLLRSAGGPKENLLAAFKAWKEAHHAWIREALPLPSDSTDELSPSAEMEKAIREAINAVKGV